MKTFPGASSQSASRFRKKSQRKRLPAEVHQLAHDLFNQLSVINLCSFKLHAVVRDTVGPAITNDLQTLDRAVEDAMLLAERLSQAIAESASLTETKTPGPAKSPGQVNNVLRLFAAKRRQPY
jgi:hypothetical protein